MREPSTAEPQPLSLFDPRPSDPIPIELPPTLARPIPPTAGPVSPALLDSLEKLVELTAKLRSPDQVWQIDLSVPTLGPYVAEEMADVLKALEDERMADRPDQTRNPENYLTTLEDLPATLLRHLAGSAEETIRLLTGIEAKVTSADGIWHRGILRLVASLTLKTPQTQETIDMATGCPPRINLPTAATVQSPDCRWCQHPTDAGSLLRQLQKAILDRLPAIAQLPHQPLQILRPGQHWQDGQLTLDWGFEFQPAPPLADPLLSTQLKLTDSAVLNRYVRELIRQELAPRVRRLFLESGRFESDEKCHLLGAIWDFVGRLDSRSCPPDPLVPPPIDLNHLTSKLLGIVVAEGTSSVVRSIGGISTRVLQPGCRWERGTVRLAAILSADFTGEHWEIDLATREPPQLAGTLLAEGAVIDWEKSDRAPKWRKIGTLLAEIAEQLRSASPELGIWMDGVEVDWIESAADGGPWQYAPEVRSRSGLVQLVLAWEWVPTPEPGATSPG